MIGVFFLEYWDFLVVKKNLFKEILDSCFFRFSFGQYVICTKASKSHYKAMKLHLQKKGELVNKSIKTLATQLV